MIVNLRDSFIVSDALPNDQTCVFWILGLLPQQLFAGSLRRVPQTIRVPTHIHLLSPVREKLVTTNLMNGFARLHTWVQARQQVRQVP